MIFAWVSLFIVLTAPASAGFGTFCDRAYGYLGLGKNTPAVVEPKALAAEDTPIYKRLREIDPDLVSALQKARQLKPELVSGKEIPKWADLESLDSILQDLKAGKLRASESGRLKELNALLPDLVEDVKNDKALQGISAAGNLKAAKPESYKPTEYELKRLYQAKLWEINRELPPALKIRGARIPFDQRRGTLVAEARALVKAQEEKYPSLYSTTGFPNREALVEAIKQESPKAKAILEMIENEEVDFVMRRPERGRWWIPKVGFQNQRISRTSQGTNSPERRDIAEAFLTFGKRSEYRDLDNDLKPKYGYLRPKPRQVLVEERNTTSGYGEDFYVFKKDRLRDRTTWTAGDSLGLGWQKKETDTPKIWHDAFIPWRNREILVPVVLPEETKEEVFHVRIRQFSEKSPLRDFKSSLPGWGYAELQYWGPVTLDEVEAFEFSKTPPSGDFLAELLKRNIKIRDATSGKPRDWKPPRSFHLPRFFSQQGPEESR